MIPMLSLNFKFKSFFIGPSFSILIPFPIPILNVFQYASMSSSFSPSYNWIKLGGSNAVEPLFKKPKKWYGKYRFFQDTWAARFPWVQLVLGSTSQNFVEQTLWHQNFKWSLLFHIENKDKFFPPKLDILQKHVSCHKAIVATLMLLSMNGRTTNMHPITRTRGFTQGEKIFTQFFFIVKMHLDLMQSKVVQNNLVLFGEVELILGLP